MRPELLAGSAARGRKLVGAPAGRPLVLVTGGSLGADALNEVVIGAAPELVRECCLVHVCGPGKRTGPHLSGYRQYEFVGPDWGDLLAAADLVVSRAGSNTLFELLSLGKPGPVAVTRVRTRTTRRRLATAASSSRNNWMHPPS